MRCWAAVSPWLLTECIACVFRIFGVSLADSHCFSSPILLYMPLSHLEPEVPTPGQPSELGSSSSLGQIALCQVHCDRLYFKHLDMSSYHICTKYWLFQQSCLRSLVFSSFCKCYTWKWSPKSLQLQCSDQNLRFHHRQPPHFFPKASDWLLQSSLWYFYTKASVLRPGFFSSGPFCLHLLHEK